MDNPVILIAIIVACASSGACGYCLGRRQGLAEGFLNGAMSVLVQGERFISFASAVTKGYTEENETDDEDEE